MKTSKSGWVRKTIVFFVIAAMAIALLPFTGFKMVKTKAAAGQPPAHSKTATENGDGTYKLELSVTGDADDVEQENAGKVNVIIVYDVSQSMLTRVSGTTGPRRADAAENVVHDFLVELAQYQNNAKDNIAVALVTFGERVVDNDNWTTNIVNGNNPMANRFGDGGNYGNAKFTYDNYFNNYGTNWDRALAAARTRAQNPRVDGPTFVLMVTDGAPTAAQNMTTISPSDKDWWDFRDYYNAATGSARNIENQADTTLFGIYAYGTEADLLDDLLYYANNGSHRSDDAGRTIMTAPESPSSHDYGQTEDAPNYYNAIDTTALQAAVDDIFEKVVQAMGIASATISDGTTNSVKTGATTTAELLEVDESSYQYWLTIPLKSGNKFERKDRNGNTITYTVTPAGDGKYTVTWTTADETDHSVTVDGEITSDNELRYEWVGKNDLYNYDPPAAHLVTKEEDPDRAGTVDWDLSSVGTLLTTVKYSVTFDVYPSQTTLDTIADIKNDPYVDEAHPGAWGELGPLQAYIGKDGKLETNTTATLTYDDTRTPNHDERDDDPIVYTNPSPVSSTAVEQLAIAKQWENELDSEGATPVKLKVLRDGEAHYEVELSEATGWQDSTFISIGIMQKQADGTYVALAGSEGHDFTFEEPKDITYHWELDIPTVHPMMIDGTAKMLIKVDGKHTAPSGANTYTIKGATYYEADGTAALTATNYRRSSLILKKIVDNESAPENAVFPFTLHVKNSLAPDQAPSSTEDPNHDSDWWVWVSVRDMTADPETYPRGKPVNDAVVSGATASGENNGWYYGVTDQDIVLNVKAGYSIRINNLPTESTYSITEGTLPSGFIFKDANVVVKTGDEDPGDPVTGGRTTSGEIELTNSIYTVTFTNDYAIEDIVVYKVWADGNNQDGLRPATLEMTLSGAPTGTTIPEPTLTKSEDGNTWTYKWEGLPKFDSSGKEIKYTVTEGNYEHKNDYTVTGSPAENKGTITNSYTPETTEATVVKVWSDGDNQDGNRPTSLNVQLQADGQNVGDPVTLTADNADANGNWTYTKTGLPKNKAGTAIQYTWTEPTVPTGYSLSGSSTQGTVTTLTNSYNPATIDVTVYKKWEDGGDQDGKRPSNLTLTLKGLPEGKTAPTPEISKDDTTNTWTYTWKGLPAKNNGSSITYTVEEESVPTGYTCAETEVANGGTIINSYTPETTTATITKEWDDEEDNDDKRPDELSVNLMKKVGNGEPTIVETVTLKASENWTKTVSDLPKYENKTEIVYSWKEATVPDGYTCDAPEAENGGTIKNTHVPETATVTVKKIWDDNENKLEKRPESIDVQLKVGDEVLDKQTLDETNKWTYTWEDSEQLPLPKYDHGEEIKYEVDEPKVPDGYIKTVDGFTITNKITSVIVDPPVQKIIKGNDALYNKGNFTFTIENESAVGPDDSAIEDIPMPTNTSVTNSKKYERTDKPGFYEFGEIEFTQPGTYVYRVKESGKVEGVTNDPEAETGKTITFTVTQNEDGSLSVSPTTDEVQLSFTNTYTEEPKTGDNNNTGFWMIIMIMAAVSGTAGVILFRKSRKEN